MAAPSDAYTPPQWRYLPNDASPLSRDMPQAGAAGWGDRVAGFVATNGDFVAFLNNAGSSIVAWGTGPDDFALTEVTIGTFYAGSSVTNRGGFAVPAYDLYFYYGEDSDNDVYLGVFEYAQSGGTATFTHLTQMQIHAAAATLKVAQSLWYYDAGNNAIKIASFLQEGTNERHIVTTFDLDTMTFTANVDNGVNISPVMGTFTSGAYVSPTRVEPGDPFQMFEDPTSSSTTFYYFGWNSATDLSVWEVTGDDLGGTAMSATPMTGSPLIDWSVDKPNVAALYAHTFGYDPVNALYWMNVNVIESGVYNQQIWTCSTPNGTWTELFNFNDDRTQNFAAPNYSRYSSSFSHCVGGRLYCAAFEEDALVEQQVIFYDIDLSDGTYTEDARTSFVQADASPNYLNNLGEGTFAFFNPYRGDTGEAIVFATLDLTFGNTTGNDYMVGYYYADAAFAGGTPFYGWGIPMGIA